MFAATKPKAQLPKQLDFTNHLIVQMSTILVIPLLTYYAIKYQQLTLLTYR